MIGGGYDVSFVDFIVFAIPFDIFEEALFI